jgi:hypothetical protein
MVRICPGCGEIVNFSCPNCALGSANRSRFGAPRFANPDPIFGSNLSRGFSNPNERMQGWLNGLQAGYDQYGNPLEGRDRRGGSGNRGCRYPLW